GCNHPGARLEEDRRHDRRRYGSGDVNGQPNGSTHAGNREHPGPGRPLAWSHPVALSVAEDVTWFAATSAALGSHRGATDDGKSTHFNMRRHSTAAAALLSQDRRAAQAPAR